MEQKIPSLSPYGTVVELYTVGQQNHNRHKETNKKKENNIARYLRVWAKLQLTYESRCTYYQITVK